MKKNVFLIIDFDSTFICLESLDELAKISLEKRRDKKTILSEIEKITIQGMEGKIPFEESLQKRLALFVPTKEDIEKLIQLLKQNISQSFQEHKKFIAKHTDQIFIISGGFREFIIPVVKELGIRDDHVLANTFRFDKEGKVLGYDRSNPLSRAGGKAEAVKQLYLSGTVVVIGDGFTDYDVVARGAADRFVAFIEQCNRKDVIKKADTVARNFGEVIEYISTLRAGRQEKVLLLENIDVSAQETFANSGYEVISLPRALGEEELIERIQHATILGIRSKTKVTRNVLKRAKKLKAVGAFCIGTDQIDLKACQEYGITVFNAPFSNTRSVTELALGEIIMLSRSTFEKSKALHRGVWDKSAKGSHEVRGKTIGIIGYGHIGTQLSILAEALGMNVSYYDIQEKLAYGAAQKCNSLQELLAGSDIITVHIDGRQENERFIGEEEFSQVKEGVIFLNLSRGNVVDYEALASAIKNGKVAGAAVDVFPDEPKKNGDPFLSPLQGLPNVILTPHIGGSTEEAQEEIGKYVSRKLVSFLKTNNDDLAVVTARKEVKQL